MNRKTRRAFLVLSAAAALAACGAIAGGGGTATPAVVITDLKNLAETLANQSVLLIAIPPQTRADISAAIAAISDVATKVANNLMTGATGVQAVFGALQTILAACAPFAAMMPGPWTTALGAAQVVLPVLATLLGIVLPASAARGSAVSAFSASLPHPDLETARAFLVSHAGRD